MVQQVVGRLTELAFDACITKPSSSLSSTEQVRPLVHLCMYHNIRASCRIPWLADDLGFSGY